MNEHFKIQHNSQKKPTHSFSNIPIDPKSFRKSKKFSTGKKKIKKIFLGSIAGIALATTIFATIRIRVNVTSELPDVSSIQNMIFSEATIIQDKNGETLYKMFQENREYIDYDKISHTIVDAIVAIEDKNYRTHNGLDAIGILKVAFHNITHPNDMRGGSTIAQQLLKNLLLNAEGKKENKKEKIVRKLKEIFLTSKLTDTLEEQIKKEQGNLDKDELHLEMKKETLELYLNYISFGNNAYGIEAAAKTYFGKPALELDPMESAILASLPKGPSYYNPYRHKDRLMGELIITGTNGEKIAIESGANLIEQSAINKLSNMLLNSSLASKKNDEAFIDFIKGLGSFSLFYNSKNYQVTYLPGRKDVVLARMFDDGYINEPELKNAFIKGLDYKFNTHKFEINAPHFVHRVIERLEKDYDKETLMNGGFIIKTSLDLNIQKLAEKAISDNIEMLDYYGANNEALLYADSLNGDVVAYVGSRDYFNDEIEGQNDMLRSPRQVGSTMKPMIYAIGFDKIGLSTETPIYDIPFKIGKDDPSNADGKFYGILPLKHALPYSRNIPAIKVFLGLGGEAVAKPLLQKMGMTSLQTNHEYGYPLALGAGEIELLELASSYMHLSAKGKPAQINPILEIRTKDGSLIYNKEVAYQEEVVKPGIAYLIRNVLSDKANMPGARVSKYSVPGLNLAIKSGTSNMKNENNQNRARDGLLVGYTPSSVLVLRGGNADGSPMNKNAYGGFLNADVLRQFYGDLLKNNYIQNQSMTAVDTTSIQISKLNGAIAGEKTPSEFVANGLTFAYKLPSKSDSGMTPITYDKLCNGKVSPYTPAIDIGNGYLIEPSSFMPNNIDLNDIKKRRTESLSISGVISTGEEKRQTVTYNYNNIFIAEPIEYCKNRVPTTDDSVSIEVRQPAIGQIVTQKTSLLFSASSSQRDIQSVIVFVDNELFTSFAYKNKANITDIQTLDLSSLPLGKHNIRVEAIDSKGYGNATSLEITTVETDTQAPFLEQNKVKIKTKEEGGYEIMLLFGDQLSSIIGGKVTLNGETIKEFEGNLAVFDLENLSTVSVIVSDSYKNVLQQDIDLNSY